MKKNEKRTMKEWVKEHKGTLIGICCCAAGFGLGCFVTDKIDSKACARGLQRFHQSGIIKFFDPATGIEVDECGVQEVIERVILTGK